MLTRTPNTGQIRVATIAAVCCGAALGMGACGDDASPPLAPRDYCVRVAVSAPLHTPPTFDWRVECPVAMLEITRVVDHERVWSVVAYQYGHEIIQPPITFGYVPPVYAAGEISFLRADLTYEATLYVWGAERMESVTSTQFQGTDWPR